MMRLQRLEDLPTQLASSSGWSWPPVERPMCHLDKFGTFTSNSIAASCSGALPILRRNGSQQDA